MLSLSLPLASDHLGLLQVAVSSLWLILKCVNTGPSLLARVDPSTRSQFRAICYRQESARLGDAVASVMHFSEFLVFLYHSLFLLLFLPRSYVRTALTRQVRSLLPSLSLKLSPWDRPPWCLVFSKFTQGLRIVYARFTHGLRMVYAEFTQMFTQGLQCFTQSLRRLC